MNGVNPEGSANETIEQDAAAAAAEGTGAPVLTEGDIAAVAAAVLASDIEPGLSMLSALRIVLAVMAGDTSVAGTVVQFKRADGVTVALTITADGTGNRTDSTPGNV